MALSNNSCILDESLEFLSDDIREIERMIFSIEEEAPFKIHQTIKHLLDGGGKRIRARLICLIGRLCDCNKKDYLKLAAAVEALHNATLLHDDVIDNSDTRRSRDTVHKLWGNKISILSGDYLLSRSLGWLGQLNNNEITKNMAEATSSIVFGEIMQLSAVGDFLKGRELYFDIITKKTAKLFAIACQAIAILSSNNQNVIKTFHDFGLNAGIAFQIKDDILDYDKSCPTGKPIGGDFLEKKITLPVMIAYNESTNKEKIFWHNIFSLDDLNHEFFIQALSIIEKYSAIKKANDVAIEYKNKSCACIESFSSNYYYKYVLNLINVIVDRKI